MGRKVNKAGRFARHGTDAGSGMGCNSPRVGHCDARMPRSVRYVRTRPVLLPSPGVYGRFMLSARLVAVRTFLSGASPPPEGAVRKAAQPMCFPGSLCRSPSALHCQTKIPSGVGNRRRGFFCYLIRQREAAASRRICCICGHFSSISAASRSCARQRSRFCAGRSILK